MPSGAYERDDVDWSPWSRKNVSRRGKSSSPPRSSRSRSAGSKKAGVQTKRRRSERSTDTEPQSPPVDRRRSGRSTSRPPPSSEPVEVKRNTRAKSTPPSIEAPQSSKAKKSARSGSVNENRNNGKGSSKSKHDENLNWWTDQETTGDEYEKDDDRVAGASHKDGRKSGRERGRSTSRKSRARNRKESYGYLEPVERPSSPSPLTKGLYVRRKAAMAAETKVYYCQVDDPADYGYPSNPNTNVQYTVHIDPANGKYEQECGSEWKPYHQYKKRSLSSSSGNRKQSNNNTRASTPARTAKKSTRMNDPTIQKASGSNSGTKAKRGRVQSDTSDSSRRNRFVDDSDCIPDGSGPDSPPPPVLKPETEISSTWKSSMIYHEPDLSNGLEDVSDEECVFSVEEEVMPSPIDVAGVEISIDEFDDFANDNANEIEYVNIQPQNREHGDTEDLNRTQLVNEVYQEDTAEERPGETEIGIDDSHNTVTRTPVQFENESEFVIEEPESEVVVEEFEVVIDESEVGVEEFEVVIDESEVVVEEFEVVIDESGQAIDESELAVIGSLSYADEDEYNPDEDSPGLIIDESASQIDTVSNSDEDELTSLINGDSKVGYDENSFIEHELCFEDDSDDDKLYIDTDKESEGTPTSTPRVTPEPEHEANSEPEQNEDQSNGDDDLPDEQEVEFTSAHQIDKNLLFEPQLALDPNVRELEQFRATATTIQVSAASAESSAGTGSTCGTSATAIVYEDISDDETEQTQTGFSGTGTTNVAVAIEYEYEDITDDENDPPKTFHFYGAKNVGVGAGATKDIFAEVQDFSKRAYNKLPISLITPKLAPTCPKELERSFQEAQIFTIGELSDCTAPEIEAHFRIQNPSHISKYKMTQIALADFWAQFLKAEEAQKKKADRLEKEQTETQESGCGPGPSTSTGGGWFMPLDELSISLLRLPVDQATALLNGARSNGTKLSE